MPVETAIQHIRRSRWPIELTPGVNSRREKSGIGARTPVEVSLDGAERHARQGRLLLQQQQARQMAAY